MQKCRFDRKKRKIINHKTLFSEIKMFKEILKFGDIKIEKNTFYRQKTPIFLKDVDIEKVLVSNKIFFGEKNYEYFIGNLYNDHKVKPLQIMIPKMSSYLNGYDGQTKCMYLLTDDDDLLGKYNTIWDIISW